ncbi:MAG: very short patch repair endonuclease [Nocardioidaceae bacterium]|nr:very short patch repair endonuclease [Nocardioidaceae bacterium]
MEGESWASSPAVRASMQGNRGRDTKPEVALRRTLHARGLRFFVNRRPLPGLRRTADLLFPRARVAVFVDGCFWHGCPEHHTVAKSNAKYWEEKVRRNRERDADTDAMLQNEGWMVIRLWAHQDAFDAAKQVETAVKPRRASFRGDTS